MPTTESNIDDRCADATSAIWMIVETLDIAADWANEAGTDPDVVERALFGRSELA